MLLFQDNCVGVNGTALAAHTPDLGGPWVDDTPGFKIEGNTIQNTGGNPVSHVEIGARKTMNLSAILDLNGCDPNNFGEFRLSDDLNNNALAFTFNGDGSIDCPARSAGGNYWDTGSQGNPFLPLPGPRVIQVSIGPDLLLCKVGGVVVFTAPRGILKTVNVTRLKIIGGPLNALPSPKMYQLSVSN